MDELIDGLVDGGMASKLYGVNATIIVFVFVFVLYCFVLYFIVFSFINL